MNYERKKDANWNIQVNENGTSPTDQCVLAVLMDIRDELKCIRHQLGFGTCHNFIAIPRVLNRIMQNTTKPKKKRKSVQSR